jgi:spermidine synthase
MTPDNLRIAFRTFVDVFPHVQVFKTGADIILLGSQSDFSFDYQSLAERLTRPEIRKLMAEIEIHTPGDLIARHYLFGSDAAHRFAAAADRLNTDDRPVLEFSARFNLGEQVLGQHQRNNMNALLAARQKAWLPLSNLGNTATEAAAAMRDLGKSFARVGMENEAAHFMRRAAEIGGG